MRKGIGALAGLIGWLALGTAPAAAEPAVGVIAGTNVLISFDTATPGTLASSTPITGLGPTERVRGIDYRWIPNDPATPAGLFALTVQDAGANDDLRLYTIDPATGAATGIPQSQIPITVPDGGAAYGFDFNPASDRIRVVNTGGDNLRINPFTGTRADFPQNDADLNPVGAAAPAVAYDRVHIPPGVPTNTTAYAIEPGFATLTTLGGINQSPSASGGAIIPVGPLGFTPAGSVEEVNLDIAPTGTAFLTANVAGTSALHTVNLTTGAATAVGPLAAPLAGFAVVPATTPPAADRAAPTITGQSVKPKKFRVGDGTKFKFTLSEAANILVAIERRKKAGRYKAAGSLSASGASGANSIKFSGKVGGKRLKPGRYRISITATDAAGNASQPAQAKFKVLEKKKDRKD